MQAAFGRHRFHAPVGKAQQPFGLSDPQLDQVAGDRKPELLFKHAGQVEFVDIKPFGQIVQRYFFGVVRVKKVFDLLHALLLAAAHRPATRMPAFLHQQRQQVKQPRADLHIPHISVRTGQRIQFFQQRLVPLGLDSTESGLPAAFFIFFIDAAHIGTVKVRPAQLPQIRPRAVPVRFAAVQENAVPCLQCALHTAVFQRAAAAFHQKNQVGRQPLPGAGMRPAGLQAADLLQMQQVGTRKGRRGIKDPAGMYQFAVEHRTFHGKGTSLFC